MTKYKTQQERLVEALKARGMREVGSRSSRYVVLTRDEISFYYVGKGGALRKGRTIASSFPMDHMKAELLRKVLPR